jgi:hypothetical protein
MPGIRKRAPRPVKSVTFRLPIETHELLTAVADLRGLDLTAMLNVVISDAVPGLQGWLKDRQGRQAERGPS